MADITMCLTEDCPMSEICYRKQATISQYQSVAYFDIYLNREEKTCEMFWLITPKK